VIWRDKQDVHILTIMHRPPTKGNFYDQNRRAENLLLLKTTVGTWAIGDGGERMANS